MSEPSAASQIGGFLLALAFIFVIYAGWTFTTRKFHKTPASTRPAAHTSREAGTTCSSTGCGYRASSVVIDHRGETRLVCKGCLHNGEAFGQWEWVGDVA